MLVRGWDQRCLAAVVGLSEGTVSKILATGHCSPATLAALARALGAAPELPLVREMLLANEVGAGIPIPAPLTEGSRGGGDPGTE
ncbi:MAG: helix-turn-helix domain-containing protein [Candidatus Dormibacteria bacterium]